MKPIITDAKDRERVRKWLLDNYRYVLGHGMIYGDDAIDALCGPAPTPKPKKRRSK